MATKKQNKITAELVARATHALGELGLDYAVVIRGVPQIFSNVPEIHAVAILSAQLRLQDKMDELRIENLAEKLTAIPGDGEDMANNA